MVLVRELMLDGLLWWRCRRWSWTSATPLAQQSGQTQTRGEGLGRVRVGVRVRVKVRAHG